MKRKEIYKLIAICAAILVTLGVMASAIVVNQSWSTLAITSVGPISGTTLTGSKTVGGATVTASKGIVSTHTLQGNSLTITKGADATTITGDTISADNNITAGKTLAGATVTASKGITAVTTIGGATVTASKGITATTTIQGATVTATKTLAGATVTASKGITSTHTIAGNSLTVTLQADVTTLQADTVNVDNTVTAKYLTTSGNIVINPIADGGNEGLQNYFIGIPKISISADPTGLDGSSTVLLIDDSPAGEWTVGGGVTRVVRSADTAIWRDVTNSLKVAIASGATPASYVTQTIGGNWSSNEYISFWIRSSKTLASGDLTINIVNGSTIIANSVLAVTVADVWQYQRITLSGIAASRSAVTSVRIVVAAGAAGKGPVNVWFDAMYKWDVDARETAGSGNILGVAGCVYSLVASLGFNRCYENIGEAGPDFFVDYTTGANSVVFTSDGMVNTYIWFFIEK